MWYGEMSEKNILGVPKTTDTFSSQLSDEGMTGKCNFHQSIYVIQKIYVIFKIEYNKPLGQKFIDFQKAFHQ